MWQNVQGHDDVADRFRQLLAKGRLASTYLFVGPEGIGKRHFAHALAACLLCRELDDELLDRCGNCDACRLTAAGNHADLDFVQRKDDKQDLTLDLFIGDRDHRNQEGLCHRLALAPVMGRRRIAIIDDADYFNQESANALLKTLEEPPRRSLIILVGTTANRQLPTIRSRCQIVRFRRLDVDTCAALLMEEGTARDRPHAEQLAQRSEGQLTVARELADGDMLEFSTKLCGWLAAAELPSMAASRAVREFVDQAGTEARLRRARLRVVLSLAADFYRAMMRSLAGCEFDDHDPLRAAARTAAQSQMGSAQMIQKCHRQLDRCLEAILQLERYANQAMLIDCWMDDLAHA